MAKILSRLMGGDDSTVALAERVPVASWQDATDVQKVAERLRQARETFQKTRERYGRLYQICNPAYVTNQIAVDPLARIEAELHIDQARRDHLEAEAALAVLEAEHTAIVKGEQARIDAALDEGTRALRRKAYQALEAAAESFRALHEQQERRKALAGGNGGVSDFDWVSEFGEEPKRENLYALRVRQAKTAGLLD